MLYRNTTVSHAIWNKNKSIFNKYNKYSVQILKLTEATDNLNESHKNNVE